MVEVRTTRVAQEILGDEGSVADCSRLDVQVAGLFDGTAEVQTSRVVLEILGDEGSVGDCSRLDVQVAGLFDAPTEVQVSRVVVEVLASPDREAANTRLDVQVAGLFDASAEVLTTRVVVECLARQGSAGIVTPLALADDAHIFLHNWASQAVLRTAFLTDMVYDPESGAEARRGLGVKPTRLVELEWLECASTSLGTLERLEVFFRCMTNQRFQMPIYMDQIELADSYATLDTTLLFNTREGRFFPGGRIGVVQLDVNFQPISSSFHIITSMTNSSVTLASSLINPIAAGSLVFPIMDCELALDVRADYTTSRVPSVSITVSEVPGDSQLPPLKSDTPPDAEVFEGRPIWFEEPDWASGIVKGRSRQGSSNNAGRALFTNPEGARSRQIHEFDVSGKRSDMWKVLEFFETRRGRLRSFWHIDQDQYMEAIDLDASGTFIGVREIGDLVDFQEEFDYVGIVMSDGKTFVRGVSNIQAILTVFRITASTPIDTGLLVGNVARVSRARLVRFLKDELQETWTHTGYMTAPISIIEVLSEDNFPTT